MGITAENLLNLLKNTQKPGKASNVPKNEALWLAMVYSGKCEAVSL